VDLYYKLISEKDKERLQPSSTNYRELQLESQYYNSVNSDIIELRWQVN